MEKEEYMYGIDNGLNNVVRTEFYDWHYYRTHLVDGELHECLEKRLHEYLVYVDDEIFINDEWWDFDVNECN